MFRRLLAIGLLTICLPLFFTIPAHASEDCFFNGQAIDLSSASNGTKKTGIVRCQDKDTRELQREVELRNGKPIGLIRLYKNGKIERDYYEDESGRKQGLARTYGSDGKAVREETYINGKTVGLTQVWHLNGKLASVSINEKMNSASAAWTSKGLLSELSCGPKPLLDPVFDDAKFCGFNGTPQAVDLYYATGKRKEHYVYLNGKSTEYTLFESNGAVIIHEETKSQWKTRTRFTPNGIKMLEQEWIKQDDTYIPTTEREFYSNGTVQTERRWAISDDQYLPSKETEYYLNGQTAKSITYFRKNGLLAAEERTYRDNGKIAAETHYFKEGINKKTPYGSSTLYNEVGRPISKVFYNSKGVVNRKQIWSDNGKKLLNDYEVFPDGTTKAYTGNSR